MFFQIGTQCYFSFSNLWTLFDCLQTTANTMLVLLEVNVRLIWNCFFVVMAPVMQYDLLHEWVHSKHEIWFKSLWYRHKSNFSIDYNTRSIQRKQTPPRLWSLTLTCDLDLTSNSKKAYVIKCRWLHCAYVPDMMFVSVIVCEMWLLVHFCNLWLLSVTFGVCQGHFHFHQ